MRINYLPSSEKKKLLEYLKDSFGIEKIPGIIVKAGSEKMRLFTGSLTKEQMDKLSETVRVELVGLYSIKKESDYRVSFDSLFLFKDQIDKNLIELDEENMKSWMKGNDLKMNLEKGVYVLKYKDFLLGCGKSNGETLFNYVPKNRRYVR